MKSIKLTKSHKSKLLEMCKKLFPEQFDINRLGMEIEFNGMIQLFDGVKFSEIHWFEFCMTHLLNEIAFKLVKSDILADVEYETYRQAYIIGIMSDKTKENYIHPVDYLYSQFKLLTKTK